MPTPGVPFRVPGRAATVPNQRPINPTNVNSNVTNTVSVTGSVTSTITGTVTVAGTVTVSGITNPITANPTTSTSVTSSQVTITTAATQIFAAGASVIFREVVNLTASVVYLGAAGVTTGSGHFFSARVFNQAYNSAALFGIVETGSVTVSTIGW